MFRMPALQKLMQVVTVLGVCVVICACLPTGQSSQCQSDGYKYFFDHGTETCEVCAEICDYADIQGTVEQCQNNCPRYIKAMKCKKEGQYFDELYDSCGSCCQLCKFNSPNVPEFNSECREKCADLVAILVPHQKPGHQGNNNAADRLSISLPPCALSSGDARSPSSGVKKTETIIIITIIGTVVLCLVLVAAFFILRAYSSKARYVHVSTHNPSAALNPTNDQLQPPVEETGALQYIAVVNENGTITAMQPDPVITAFADLGVRHDRSQLSHV